MGKEAMSCVQSARGPLVSPKPGPTAGDESQIPGEEVEMALARVGHKAPDFEATAFMDGGFKNVKLSDYMGKWVIICFYPGDFTFV